MSYCQITNRIILKYIIKPCASATAFGGTIDCVSIEYEPLRSLRKALCSPKKPLALSV